jgi:hypothetical protein
LQDYLWLTGQHGHYQDRPSSCGGARWAIGLWGFLFTAIFMSRRQSPDCTSPTGSASPKFLKNNI